MDALYKQLTESEMSMIKARLLAWQEHDDISWIMRTHGDINYALHALFMLSSSGMVAKFYKRGIFQGILVFDVGVPWWTSRRVVSELFVLAAPGVVGLQREVIAELDVIADRYGADLIVSGNMFQANNNLIGNGYKKCGFSQECSTYVKEAIYEG